MNVSWQFSPYLTGASLFSSIRLVIQRWWWIYSISAIRNLRKSRKCELKYRVIRNDCRDFNNLSYTIHFRWQYMYFLFNRTTLPVFVTYLTGALYVHRLWFYKRQHDNPVRSKLFVTCQRWWLQWRFWFVPSVPGYLREEEEHKPHPWRNPIERDHMGLRLENEVASC